MRNFHEDHSTSVDGGCLRAARWILTAFICVALVLPPHLWAQQTAGTPNENGRAASALEAARDQARQQLQALTELSKRLPREPLSPRDLVDRVGREPDALLQWMTVHVQPLPYRGLLRGSMGVLIERRGNSLDTAVLLAEALTAAGHDVRLARAELSAEVAQALHDQIRMLPAKADARPETEFSVHDLPGVDQASVAAAVEKLQAQGKRFQDELSSLADAQSDALRSSLRAAGVTDTAAGAEESQVEALREHWWPQIRQDGSWRDLDPLLNRLGDQIERPNAKTYHMLKNLPDALRHTIRIRVIAERLDADRLHEEAALEFRTPAADLTGGWLTLAFSPVSSPGGEEPASTSDRAADQALLKTVREETEWRPALVVHSHTGETTQVVQQASIHTDGTLNRKPSTDAKAKKFKGAAGALGALNAKPKQLRDSHLTGLWLEYHTAVDGKTRTVRRALFDLLGPARRALLADGNPLREPLEWDDAIRERRGLALSGEAQILPLNCRLSSDFITRLALKTAIEHQQVVLKLLDAAGANKPARVDEVAEAVPTTPLELYGLAQSRLSLGRFRDRVLLDEPNLLSTYLLPVPASAADVQHLGDDGPLVQYAHGIDIVLNGVGVLAAASADEPSAWDVRVEQGVTDTLLETFTLRGPDEEPKQADARYNASSWLARHPIEQWEVVKAVAERTLPSTNTASRIRGELEAGRVAMVPRDALSAGASDRGDQLGSCYWQVDPATGDTLGIGPHGWGQEFIERLELKAMFWMVKRPFHRRAAQRICFFAAVAARLAVADTAAAIGEKAGAPRVLSIAMAMVTQAGYTGVLYKYVELSCQILFLRKVP